MNIPLLRQIQEQIRNEPESFFVGVWISVPPDRSREVCTADIAGFAIMFHQFEAAHFDNLFVEAALLFNPDFNIDGHGESIGSGYSREVQEMAALILGLNIIDAQRLFYVEDWPIEFTTATVDGPETTAEMAVKRIDRFIETEGRE